MQHAVRRHDELLQETIAAHGGVVFKTVGDAFCAAFSRPEDAVAAALESQKRLRSEDFSAVGGLHVRGALHTGTTDERNGDYFGPTVNKVARLLAVGHGGQILLSGVTADLVHDKLPANVALRDLGRHRLKDLAEPTAVVQLTAPELPLDFPVLRSLDAQPNNLPAQLTSFIGRESELREAQALLQQTRLLTLAGAGGVGKTRMAVQLAADVCDQFPDGVWFVDLAPLSDGIFISPTMLATIGAREEPGRDTTETLADSLREKTALIVLDNCEHVIAEAARLSERLLRDCTKLKVVTTTREALGIAAETIFRVSTFGETDGVQLFLTRARAVAPSFELTPRNAELVGQICRRLDGIALGIELAAARVKMMSVEDLWKRLDDRFRILTGGSRTALARQQTLRGLIDWSYNLLEEPEKIIFRRLAIFAGDFSLDSATAVCAFGAVDEFESLDILTHLIDKSLVQFEPDRARYWLLDSTRAYALEWLADSNEWETLQRRRVDHFRAAAEAAKGATLEGRTEEMRAQFGRDYGEYRSILQWTLLEGNDVSAGAATATCFTRYWQERGLYREGRFWLEHALQHGAGEIGVAIEADLHLGIGAMALAAGEAELMETHGREALNRYTSVGDTLGIFRSRNAIAISADLLGRYDEAYDLYQQNLADTEQAASGVMHAVTLLNLGELLTRNMEDYEEADRLLEASVAELRAKEGSTYFIASAIEAQARAACYAEHYDRAEALARDAVDIFRDVGDEPRVLDGLVFNLTCRVFSGKGVESAESFEAVRRMVEASANPLSLTTFAEACALLANSNGDARSAVTFASFAGEKRMNIKVPRDAHTKRRLEAILTAARASLGEAEFGAASARGKVLTPEAMFESASSLAAAAPAVPPVPRGD